MSFKDYLKELVNEEVKVLKDTNTRLPSPILTFDFSNKTITAELNGVSKTWKVVPDNKFTISVKKTQINAKDGIEGIYKQIKQSVDNNFGTDLYFPKFEQGLKLWGIKQI